MNERDWLAERFEENRPHLRAVAYRVLGSVSEADDAVQETWLRLSRSGADEVENLGGFSGRAKALRPALIDGAPGLVWTLRGETQVVFAFTISGDTITAIEQIADADRIARLEVVPLKAGVRTRRA